MKATFSLLILMIIFIGFGLIGDALAQSDDPTPAASDSGPTSPESGEVKTEDTKPDETKPAEGEPSEAEGEEAEGKEEGDTESAEPTPTEAASGFVQALRSGEWLTAVGFACMLIVWFMRSVLFKRWDWAQTKKGGLILGGVVAVLGVIGLPLMGGAGFSFSMLLAAFNALAVSGALWGWGKDAKEAMA